ncbi:MAG: F0F1 ATP synthase subunit A [Puniceicoccales bacterium]|jgi:F-type H+-transporting ATPase subunit a|nr:F0F1 ATP synthase subunit A [Puniceicoccales bacterium]
MDKVVFFHKAAIRLMVSIVKLLPMVLVSMWLGGVAYASDGHSNAAEVSSISTAPEVVFGSGITDTLVTSWVISLAIILLVRWLVGPRPGLIPGAGQAMIETILDGLQSIMEPIVGKKAFRQVFPLLFGYFVFILLQNWSGLFPGIGSILHKVGDSYLGILRPINSDLNATLAMALISLMAWMYLCIKHVGINGLYGHIFGNKAEKEGIPGFMYAFLFVIFFGVGLIECISVLFRGVSLSFRLYGNVFGGDNLLHNMYTFSEFLTNDGFVKTELFATISKAFGSVANVISFLIKYLAYLLPLPFYFLEILVGLIQAFVFTLLVAVYIGLIVNHEDEPHSIDLV